MSYLQYLWGEEDIEDWEKMSGSLKEEEVKEEKALENSEGR